MTQIENVRGLVECRSSGRGTVIRHLVDLRKGSKWHVHICLEEFRAPKRCVVVKNYFLQSGQRNETYIARVYAVDRNQRGWVAATTTGDVDLATRDLS